MDGYQTKAYAKINLGLDVVKRLPNGYHQVKMIMQNIGIHDELTFEKAEHAVTILTDSEELPTDKNNLIHKAGSGGGKRGRCRHHERHQHPLRAGALHRRTDGKRLRHRR